MITEGKAQELAIEKYGLLKGSRLIAYAAQLYALGPEDFDKRASQQQRSKMLRELLDAGVNASEIRWGALVRTQRRLHDELVRSREREAERRARAGGRVRQGA